MLLHIHPDNPQPRNIQTVVECLRSGGVIIYPTDTIYGIGCDIYNQQAIERICRIKNILPKNANFSFICRDLSHLSDYARNIDTPIFRILKNALPGPYTFILEATKEVPKSLKTKKDTVGIRVPDHIISPDHRAGVGAPADERFLLMDEDVEYFTDPEMIHDIFGKQVDLVIDSGIGNMIASTVIDCTDGTPQLVREGAGKWEGLVG